MARVIIDRNIDGFACFELSQVVLEDAYYHSQAHLTLEERAVLNFDHPDALDHELLEHDLRQLKARKAVR